ncbi:hypothetical protein Q7C36_015457 [Tachysurus vachellii]|uniref:Uncharacterized protein n=1 Tax=Tachysurus vachellii TaxID=175792 RepID=A0AA88MC35_TACVA|nr:hypothetical protein Q7C36_015457 [Tachysurus vachellii]
MPPISLTALIYIDFTVLRCKDTVLTLMFPSALEGEVKTEQQQQQSNIEIHVRDQRQAISPLWGCCYKVVQPASLPGCTQSQANKSASGNWPSWFKGETVKEEALF